MNDSPRDGPRRVAGGERVGRLARVASIARGGRDTIATGALSVVAGQLLIYVLGFVASVLISRTLGPAGRGLYLVPVTAVTLAATLVHLSVEASNTFLFAERNRNLSDLSLTSTTLAMPLAAIGGFGVAVAFLLGRHSFFQGVELQALVLVACTLPLQLHLLWLTNIFQLARRVSFAQFVLVAGAVVQFVGVTVLWALGRLTVTSVLVMYIASIAVPWVLLVIEAEDFAPVRFGWRPRELGEVLLFGVQIHAGVLSTFLLLRFDVLLVNAYLGVDAVGIYTLSVLLAELIWMLTNPLVVATLPMQARMSLTEAGELSFRAVRINAVLAVGLSVGFVATGWLLVPLLYGAEFSDAYPVACALLPGVVLMTAARPLTNWLIRHGRPWRLGLVGSGALGLNIVLNVLLLPRVGLVGASIASSIAYAAYALVFVTWGKGLIGRRASELVVPTREDFKLVAGGLALIAKRLRRVDASTRPSE